MRIKESWIISAIEALTTGPHPIVNEEEFNEVYKGYISNFGASIVQMGLLPTVIFYENSPSAAADKNRLIIAIQFVLSQQFSYDFPAETTLSAYIMNHLNNKLQILSDIEKSAVAIKLALRIFNPRQNEEED